MEKEAFENWVKQLKTKRFWLAEVLVILSIFMACRNTSPQSKAGETPFFDLSGFLKHEMKGGTLTRVKKVQKTVSVNGKAETQELTIADWETELQPFLNSDINRPAWTNKYMVKKTTWGNHGVHAEYYALADHLKTRQMIVDDPMSWTSVTIDILNAEKTMATNAETHLHYNSTKGYSILTAQKVLGGVDSVRVDVRYIFE